MMTFKRRIIDSSRDASTSVLDLAVKNQSKKEVHNFNNENLFVDALSKLDTLDRMDALLTGKGFKVLEKMLRTF